MKLYLVAGEASGDARGAELIRSLRARRGEIDVCGFGGPQIAGLGGPAGAVHDWIGRWWCIGIIDVVKHYGFFQEQFAVALGGDRAGEAGRGGADRLPGVQSSACRRLEEGRDSGGAGHLLHLPAGLGVESLAASRDGAHA